MIILPKTPLRFIFFFIKENQYFFALLVLLAIIGTVNQTLFPYAVKLIVNYILNFENNNSYFNILKIPLLFLFSFWIGIEIIVRMRDRILLKIMPKLRVNVRDSLYNYFKQQPYSYFIDKLSGNIAHKISNLPEIIETSINMVIFGFIPLASFCIIIIIFSWFLSPFPALIILIWCISQVFIAIKFYKNFSHASAQQAEILSIINEKIVDTLNNMLAVRLFFREEYEHSILKESQNEEINKTTHLMKQAEKMRLIQSLSSFLLIISLTYYLIYGWHKAFISLGDFTLISMLSFGLVNSFYSFGFQLCFFLRNIESIRDTLNTLIIEQKSNNNNEEKRKILTISKGDITFINVNFSYIKEQPIFKRLNVRIVGGQRVGLVGFTGSGKTSFINLLLQCYEPSSGKILIDNQEIRAVTQKSLREQISVVTQDPWLFHRTIKENILYGNPRATDKEVFEAATLSHCHEFIEQLENGYDSLIGERGINLSNGQRQRISIARAILKKAPILILDEATSSLDLITEAIVQKSILSLTYIKTLFIITHRLSVLTEVDRVLVFKDGDIIEDAPKRTLLSLKGQFYELWKTQLFHSKT